MFYFIRQKNVWVDISFNSTLLPRLVKYNNGDALI